MGDSDREDEYDRRREKFRSERSDYNSRGPQGPPPDDRRRPDWQDRYSSSTPVRVFHDDRTYFKFSFSLFIPFSLDGLHQCSRLAAVVMVAVMVILVPLAAAAVAAPTTFKLEMTAVPATGVVRLPITAADIVAATTGTIVETTVLTAEDTISRSPKGPGESKFHE